ncbi:MAG: endonuclease/exonuclease/phosphatase family protein [Flavobacteriaceae bacterium]|nr:endonuclease/exonuclease/phosphatase family protein [Flavobacteriaceae bacterium]
MKQLNVTFLSLMFTFMCFSQKEKTEYKINTIAFYNVENLFDTINDPNTRDENSPIMQLKTEQSTAYWNKIENMAQVLSEIGKETAKSSPAIIGLAEIENSAVLEDLINNPFLKNGDYDYVHIDSPDWRGIDVALLYKKALFDPIEFKAYQVSAFNQKGYRIKTRDQLLVSGYLDDELIHIIVNHWPSQRGGKQKSARLREKSAELNVKILDEIRQAEPSAKIITLGDFNDNPTENSFKKILKTVDSKEELSENSLYNPFEKMFKKGLGTLGFRDQLNLFDQIILSENWCTKEYSDFTFYKAGIYNPDYLTQKKGKYKGYPYRSWSSTNTFTGGYSDHYPVYIFVIKEL